MKIKKLFKKITSLVLVLEFILVINLILFSIPVIGPAMAAFLPPTFYIQGSVIFTMFGIISLVPTLLVYASVSYFISRDQGETKQIESKVNKVSNIIAWTLIICFVAFWVIVFNGFFDRV